MNDIRPKSNWVRMFCALFLFFFASLAFAGEVVVQKGDALSRIADKSKIEGGWKALWEMNKDTVKNPNLIFPGQKLRTPDAAVVIVRKEDALAPLVRSHVRQVGSISVIDVTALASAKMVITPVADLLREVEMTVAQEAQKQGVAIAAPAVAASPLVSTEVHSASKLSETSDRVDVSKGDMNRAQGPPPQAEPPTVRIVEPSPTELVAVNPDAKVKTEPKATAPAATTSVVDEFNNPSNWKSVFANAQGREGFKQNDAKNHDVQVSARSLRDELGDASSWKVVTISSNPLVPAEIQTSAVSPSPGVQEVQSQSLR